jgi:hypothetical protein
VVRRTNRRTIRGFGFRTRYEPQARDILALRLFDGVLLYLHYPFLPSFVSALEEPFALAVPL